MKSNPNPYLLALFTAALAGIFSFAGSWYVSGKQIEAIVIEERLSSRRLAYQSFIESVTHDSSPLLNRLLHIGSMADSVATDSEVQALEDEFAVVVQQLYTFDTYTKLSSDLAIVRIHGSEAINRIADDLLYVVSFHHYKVDVKNYPESFQNYWISWNDAQKNTNYLGWEPKISGEERFTAVISARLFSYLLETIRQELQDDPI